MSLHINMWIIFAILQIATAQDVEGPNPESAFKISPTLLSLLESGETPNIMVSFVGGNREPLERTSLLRFNDKGQRGEAVYQSLVEHSDQSQEGLVQMLSSRSVDNSDIEFKKFWIINQMWIKGADMKMVRMIAEDPLVARIKVESAMELIGGEDERGRPDHLLPRPEDGVIQWNINLVRAPQAWEELGGSKGEGVVVGVIDSGILHTHEALKENFLGDYGWFDATRGRLEPYQDGFHGTFVTGIAVGKYGIGVAPGAKWAACKACFARCPRKHLFECGEFFACPTLANGTNRDCSKAPHVLVNSWGGPESNYDDDDWEDMHNMIQSWHSMGIVPVFALGNAIRCESALFPASHPDVIGVSSVSIKNTTDGTGTSLGPTKDGRIKPELTAPGEDVLTSSARNDDLYSKAAGTSFACPHVAGVVALLLSRDKEMSYSEVRELLLNNTDRESLQMPQKDGPYFVSRCGSVSDGVLLWPNNHYGFGLVNAEQALKAQTLALANRK